MYWLIGLLALSVATVVLIVWTAVPDELMPD
jgi:hypothetical protein